MFLHNRKNIAIVEALLDEVTKANKVGGDISSQRG
jgi:hypothetical protein